ncbi:MAG: hypothetical protein RMJ59_02055 [Candidatus Nitrosocaldus sp.]|nr:hypothetical protein [Candidatus Nitrosocaldus sp.]MCS7141567.1 hypothetical protein [Candidatus Nitrosocaldus sp.]MDW8000488.1 hypothetical protein [Candidatus Nitrosocaldus sp.]MDW8275150.1 hypothetical protein [Candidatus Nitrosocaldus sp.]
MDRVRACPVCPVCAGRKFRIVANQGDGMVVLECLRCSNRIIV